MQLNIPGLSVEEKKQMESMQQITEGMGSFEVDLRGGAVSKLNRADNDKPHT